MYSCIYAVYTVSYLVWELKSWYVGYICVSRVRLLLNRDSQRPTKRQHSTFHYTHIQPIVVSSFLFSSSHCCCCTRSRLVISSNCNNISSAASAAASAISASACIHAPLYCYIPPVFSGRSDILVVAVYRIYLTLFAKYYILQATLDKCALIHHHHSQQWELMGKDSHGWIIF